MHGLSIVVIYDLDMQMSDIKLTPPRVKQMPTQFEHHGDKRIDPYAWLRDPTWQDHKTVKEPAIIDHLC